MNLGWLALAGIGALILYDRAREGARSLKASKATPPNVPTSSEGDMGISIPSVPEEEKERHRRARKAIASAFESLGLPSEPSLLWYAQANGWLETGYGTWYFRGAKGEKIPNDANWGSIHCSASAPDSECLVATDTESGTTGSEGRHSTRFRAYHGDHAKGATDMVREVLVRRPRVRRALESKDASAMSGSLAMRREKYVVGFCPLATARYGEDVAKESFKSPDRDEGTRACAKEAVQTHAGSVWNAFLRMAAAFDERPPIPLGDYDSALRDYLAREKP